MPKRDDPLNLLYALRDVGVEPPQIDRLRVRVQASVQSEIERELSGGVRRHKAIARRLRRPAAGSLVAVLSTCVTLGVALAAILLLAHPRAHAPEAGGSRADDALIGKLAVLRRPQTTADWLPAWVRRAATQRGGGAIIPSLSRLVAVTPHARLFLVVRRPAGGTAPFWSPSLGDQVSIISVVGADSAETPPVPAAGLDNSAEVMPSAGDRGFATDSPGSLFVAILPDGVARVRWTFADEHFPYRRRVDIKPVDNVAYVPFTQRTSGRLHVTWYRSDGTVVPTSAQALQRANATHDAILRAQLVRYDERHSYQANPTLLTDFSVFSITSPTGVKTAGGNTISHPPLSALPFSILLGAASLGQPSQPDPREIRQVTTPAGDRLWVIPGRRGLCLAAVERSRPADGHSAGAASSCSHSIALATSAGVAITSRHLGGPTTTFRIVPKTAPPSPSETATAAARPSGQPTASTSATDPDPRACSQRTQTGHTAVPGGTTGSPARRHRTNRQQATSSKRMLVAARVPLCDGARRGAHGGVGGARRAAAVWKTRSRRSWY